MGTDISRNGSDGIARGPQDELADLRAQLAAQEAEIARLTQEVTSLRAQLDHASGAAEWHGMTDDQLDAPTPVARPPFSLPRATALHIAEGRAVRAEADLTACQQAHQRLREELAYPLAQLRHAYAQIHGKRVSRRGMQQFADGLIAPQIRRLEAALGSTDLGNGQDAGLGTDTQRSGSDGIVRGPHKTATDD